jgi:large repetitive protein
MSPRRCRPRLEALEGRDTPGNLTVTFAAASHTLTIVGDSLNNDLAVHTIPDAPTTFILSSATDSINNVPPPLITPSGVQNITIRMLAGDDQVTVVGAFLLAGSLSINGGDGANAVTATNLSDLFVGKNLTITNGTNTVGIDSTTLENLTVRGALTINNGNGDSQTVIQRNAIPPLLAPNGFIVTGNVTVVNGTGRDGTVLKDTNVGGNFTVKNGHGDAAGAAGYTQTFNVLNAGRSYIRGNVSVSYLDGDVTSPADALLDVEVQGNVAFAHGGGASSTHFDGFSTALPVIVRGNLTMTGSGASAIGTGDFSAGTGLIVGKNFTATAGAGSDILTFKRLEVGGAVKWALGDGNNTVTVDDSLFIGTVTLITGAGADTVNLDTAVGTGGATTFERAVMMNLGAGDDKVIRVGPTDANQELVILDTFVIHHGTGSNTMVDPISGHEVYPFGTTIQWIF